MDINFESLCDNAIVTTQCEAVAISEELCISYIVALLLLNGYI